jgi:hypothetical protein
MVSYTKLDSQDTLRLTTRKQDNILAILFRVVNLSGSWLSCLRVANLSGSGLSCLRVVNLSGSWLSCVVS